LRMARLAASLSRDEHPEKGMLMVALDVLLRVHRGVFSALRAAPIRSATGELMYANWDVRHVLQKERKQVGADSSMACVAQAKRHARRAAASGMDFPRLLWELRSHLQVLAHRPLGVQLAGLGKDCCAGVGPAAALAIYLFIFN
jgi:hypothetical protein